MNSDSQWDRAQAEWQRTSGERHRDQRATEGYAAEHRRAMENREPHWVPVEDGPLPDYDAGDEPASFD